MIPPEGVKILTFEIFLQEVHIRREFHTYPENFKSLAIIVLSGQHVRRNTKRNKERKPLILELGHYHIVGTVMNAQSMLIVKCNSAITFVMF